MRVAIVMGAKGWRGSVTSFVKVAEGLADRGHEALFCTAAGPVPERLRLLGHDVVELAAKNTGPREVWALHRVLRDRAIDVIYADTPRDLRLAAYATRLRRCPIAYRYNVNARPPRGDFGDKMFARAVDAVVLQSAWMEGRVRAKEPWLAARPTIRIPNGFDTARFRPVPDAGATLRSELGLAADVTTVLCASVFAPGKRQDFLMEVLGRVRERGRRVVCLLAGGTREQATFLPAAEASGVEIKWLGRPPTEELPAIYAAADIVALPSDIEGFGNVIGEAMACERAVVIPDAGGSPEVAGDNAIIVPSEDPLAWATAIERLIDDPAERAALGGRAREWIVNTFPVTRMQTAHMELFQRLAAGERP